MSLLLRLLGGGVPSIDRLSQLPVESVTVPTSARARLTQAALEAITAPTSARARLTQGAVEVIIVPPVGPFPQVVFWRN